MKPIEIILLIIPATVYALWNGRNGIVHPAYKQVVIVSLIMLVTSVLVSIIWHVLAFKCLLVSITGFGLIFPYAFNWYWWSKYQGPATRLNYVLIHLSKKAWPDRVFLKYNVHYLVRLALYVTLFVLSLIWFLT